MSTEPTSALDFDDLTLEIALFLSAAYYGANGTEVAQVPSDAHDLATCRRHVNNGIRQFIADAPEMGWRWTRPIAQVVLWPAVELDDDVTATGVYDAATYTVITASEASFYPSMEGKSIVVTDTDTYTIHTYVSSTVVWILGDNAFAGKTFSIAADGNYTLPRTFGGTYTGDITYAAATNIGAHIEWTSESHIRRWREPAVVVTSYPLAAAVRRMADTPRRWELVVYPTASEELTVEFPFDLHFDTLTAAADLHPAGYQHDEAVKAACLAVAERDTQDSTSGSRWQDYLNRVLPNAYKIDARTAPRKLGNMGGPVPLTLDDHRRYVQRPTIDINTRTGYYP